MVREIKRERDYSEEFQLIDDISRLPVDLFKYYPTGSIQISRDVTIPLSCSIVSHREGRLNISLGYAALRTVSPGTYPFELRIQSGTIERKLYDGLVEVK